MLAETHGKLSVASAQELDRLEDLLTDYVFGAIRHLPRSRVLLPLLQAWFPGELWPARDVEAASVEFWPMFGSTEPDVLIRVGARTVVVEAKLWSGFGKGLQEEDDQLIREYRVASEWAGQRRLEPPLVLAVTAGLDEPPEVVAARAYVGKDDAARFQWTNWQSIAGLLAGCRSELDRHEQALVDDVLTVAERRGVRTMFQGFETEDYWLMAAAQRRSSKSVFPTIATFCRDLMSRAKDHGIGPGAGGTSIRTHNSSSFNHPERWGLNYLYLPLWPDHWPKRNEWIDALLFVQFSLREPEVWIGYRQRIKTKHKDPWLAELPATVDALRQLGDRSVLEAKYPDLGVAVRVSAATALDEGTFRMMLDDTEIFLSVYRSLPLDSITGSGVVAEMLQEDVGAIEAVPILLGEGLPGTT